MQDSKIQRLKAELGPQLKSPDQVQASPGVPTGWAPLDRFLRWHGLPKSSVSLMISESGGATTLWSRAAAKVTGQGGWVAWMDAPVSLLTPWSLRHRQVDLSRLIYVSAARDERQLLWCLQELMSLSLFELIGCDLGEWELKEHQILKLKKLALRYEAALVLIARRPPRRLNSILFPLVLQFGEARVCVARALHRSTPHVLERKDLYADTLPQLAAGRHALCG